MVIGNSKYVFFEFLPYEYKALEKYLNKMALKGWKLKSIQGKFLKFIRMEPKQINYSVDTVENISLLEGRDSDTALEYREYCEAAGWSFVCEDSKIQIFYSEENSQSIDIHTDEEEKFKNISKASIKYIILTLFTVALLLYTQYINTLGSYDARFLSDDAQLYLVFAIGIWAVKEFYSLISYTIWKIKGLKALKNNEKVNYEYRISNIFRRIMAKAVFIAAIISLILTVWKESITISIASILVIISIIISDRFVNFIVSKTKNKSEKKVLYISSVIILTSLIMIVVSSLVFKNESLESYFTKEANVEYVLTLEDFNDESLSESIDNNTISENELDELYDPYIDDQNGVLAESLVYIDEGKNGDLSYELFTSNHKWAVDYKLNKLMNDTRYNYSEYKVIECNLPDDIKVYKNSYDRYILVSEDKVLEIGKYYDSQSEDEFLKIVYKSVFKK